MLGRVEDAITLVTLGRSAADGARELAAFEVPSEPGNERLAIDRVAERVRALEQELNPHRNPR